MCRRAPVNDRLKHLHVHARRRIPTSTPPGLRVQTKEIRLRKRCGDRRAAAFIAATIQGRHAIQGRV